MVLSICHNKISGEFSYFLEASTPLGRNPVDALLYVKISKQEYIRVLRQIVDQNSYGFEKNQCYIVERYHTNKISRYKIREKYVAL